jgi:hypothetical protein
MVSRLERNLPVLQQLRKAKRKPERNAILKHSNKEVIICICEVIDNILRGNVPITTTQKKKLLRYKSELRRMANKQVGIAGKKKILLQKGGFLPVVLAPILGIAASLLGEALRK